MDDDLITFAVAAKELDVHPNTLKNWQRAGRLVTAQKRKHNGVITWMVELEDARQVAQQSPAIIEGESYNPDNQPQQSEQPAHDDNHTTNTDKQYNQHKQPQQAALPPAIRPEAEATMLMIQRSIMEAVTPLNETIRELSQRNQDLALEVGALRARVELLQAATSPAPAVEVQISAPARRNACSDSTAPQAAQPMSARVRR